MSPDTGHRASFSETTLQSLAGKLATHGEKDAIVFFERGREERWSYAQLADHTERLAHGLAAGGIGRGERVAICARNRPEWIVACLATLRSGAVPVLLDTQLAEPTLQHVPQDSGGGVGFARVAISPATCRIRADARGDSPHAPRQAATPPARRAL